MAPPSMTRKRMLQGIPAAIPAMAGPLSPSPRTSSTESHQWFYNCCFVPNPVEGNLALKAWTLPGPSRWTSEGGPSVVRARGMTRNRYDKFGSRFKTSALRAEPGFRWMVRYPSEAPLDSEPLLFSLGRFGPFTCMSNPSQKKHKQFSLEGGHDKKVTFAFHSILVQLVVSPVTQYLHPYLLWAVSVFNPVYEFSKGQRIWFRARESVFVCSVSESTLAPSGSKVSFCFTCNDRGGRDLPGQCDDGSFGIREQTEIWDRRSWRKRDCERGGTSGEEVGGGGGGVKVH